MQGKSAAKGVPAPPDLVSVFPLVFPDVDLLTWTDWSGRGRNVTVFSNPVPKVCELARLILAPVGLPWIWPWAKGQSRRWFGRRVERKRAQLRSLGTVTGLWVGTEALMIEECEITWEIFSPAAFDVQLRAPRMQPGTQVRVSMRGHAIFRCFGLLRDLT